MQRKIGEWAVRRSEADLKQQVAAYRSMDDEDVALILVVATYARIGLKLQGVLSEESLDGSSSWRPCTFRCKSDRRPTRSRIRCRTICKDIQYWNRSTIAGLASDQGSKERVYSERWMSKPPSDPHRVDGCSPGPAPQIQVRFDHLEEVAEGGLDQETGMWTPRLRSPAKAVAEENDHARSFGTTFDRSPDPLKSVRNTYIYSDVREVAPWND